MNRKNGGRTQVLDPGLRSGRSVVDGHQNSCRPCENSGLLDFCIIEDDRFGST